MRHNKKGSHLGRTTSHKKAMMQNLIISLIEHKSINTTHAKAVEARRFVDRLVTYAKKGTVHHRRMAFKFLQNKEAVKTLFDEIGPACQDRPGGYTRIIKLGFRKGDAAPISMMQFVDMAAMKAASGKEESAEKEEKKKSKKTATAE